MKLAFAVSSAIGLVISVLTIVAWTRGRRSLSWPSVPGEMIEAKVVETTVGRSVIPYWDVVVSYRYSVNGMQFSGKKRRFGDALYTARDDARSEATRLMTTPSVIFYDPARHENSVLQPGPVRDLGWGLFCWSSVFVGCLILAIIV